MRRYVPILLFILLLTGPFALAQQDPMYAEYMFNSLAYNPAYAGAKEHLAISLIHRTQWWKMREAPRTQSFSIHAPLTNKRVGLGLHALHDQVGISRTLAVYGCYAYRIELETGTLSAGLQAGGHYLRQDLGELSLKEAEDEAFLPVPSSFYPNIGFGLYFQNEHFYAGFSAPRLLEPSLQGETNSADPSRLRRHYYLQAGGAIPLSGKELIFKPSLLVRNVGLFGGPENGSLKDDNSPLAPTEIDLDISFFIAESIWIGSSLRAALANIRPTAGLYKSIDLWGAFYFDNGLRIGGAFDYPLGTLQSIAGGSFELFIGYEFDIRTKRMATPRYF